MDGFMGRDGMTGLPDAILAHEGRLSAAEQAIRERVTYEKLNNALNDLRRDLGLKIEQSEKHTGEKIDKLGSENQARMMQQQLQLTSAFQAMADSAAEKAVEKQREAERKAREEIDNKARDASRGIRITMGSVGTILGGVIAIVVLFVCKAVFGWSPF
jgi:Fe2+ transport system protein B